VENRRNTSPYFCAVLIYRYLSGVLHFLIVHHSNDGRGPYSIKFPGGCAELEDLIDRPPMHPANCRRTLEREVAQETPCRIKPGAVPKRFRECSIGSHWQYYYVLAYEDVEWLGGAAKADETQSGNWVKYDDLAYVLHPSHRSALFAALPRFGLKIPAQVAR